MLKRYQVLLNDWLADYIKFYSEQYDLSFSEVIRLMLSMEISSWVSAIYPKYKSKISNKRVLEELKKAKIANKLQEKQHKLISKIYFETRKAAEFILAQVKKTKK